MWSRFNGVCGKADTVILLHQSASVAELQSILRFGGPWEMPKLFVVVLLSVAATWHGYPPLFSGKNS